MASAASVQTEPDEVGMPDDDGVRWLALLIRQGLLLIVAGIEQRYRLSSRRR